MLSGLSPTTTPHRRELRSDIVSPMATDLLVFDCDGVLVDSEVIVIEIEADLLTAAVGGMPEFLAGLTLLRCIASSSDLDRVQLSLDVTDLTQFFDPDHVFSAQMVQNGKPSPDLFLHAATQVGIDPSDCLVIEDSPHGVTAAIRINDGRRPPGVTRPVRSEVRGV